MSCTYTVGSPGGKKRKCYHFHHVMGEEMWHVEKGNLSACDKATDMTGEKQSIQRFLRTLVLLLSGCGRYFYGCCCFHALHFLG